MNPCHRLFLLLFLPGFLAVAGFGTVRAQTPLADARHGFTTHLVTEQVDGHPPDQPPAKIFRLVKYLSPVGELSAYCSVPPADGKQHPAILWIAGGFSNSIDSIAWQPGPRDNDQSASAFREAGILMMYPSLRGGNDNPGHMEGFYGEVDDVLAARDWLAKQPSVDPDRIYLGGHSTGGTLVLLTAEYSPGFRGVFAFGPVVGPRGYGEGKLLYDTTIGKETELRAPYRWLQGVSNPTYVFEGEDSPSNINALHALEKSPHSLALHFFPVPGVSHFSILRPVTRLIAQKIVADSGRAPNITFTPEEIVAAVVAK